MILTVIQNHPDVPLDRFGEWFAQADEPVQIELVRPFAGDDVPALADCGDGLLVLGGHTNAYDDVAAPWLPATRALLAEAVKAQVPTLGLCLGAQLPAVATGGSVQVAAPPGREAGVIDLIPRPAAADDALLGPLAADVPADHPLGGGLLAVLPSMHADAVVTLPAQAVWLASSAQYPYQAFRVGPAAWGLQFHPEAGPQTVLRWAQGLPDVDADLVATQLADRGAEIERAARLIALTFADLVADAAAEAAELVG